MISVPIFDPSCLYAECLLQLRESEILIWLRWFCMKSFWTVNRPRFFSWSMKTPKLAKIEQTKRNKFVATAKKKLSNLILETY